MAEDLGDDERACMLPDDHVAEYDADAASLNEPFDEKTSRDDGSAVSVLLGMEASAPEKIGTSVMMHRHVLVMCLISVNMIAS